MAKDKKAAKRGDSGDEEGGKVKRKKYDKELSKLHVELVKLQEWVKYKGLRICIVLEGRDDQGDHRARQSARVPRYCAALADGTRKEPDVHPALPAVSAGGGRSSDLGPQLVQPRRGRARDGLHQRGAGAAVSATRAGLREDDGRIRHPPPQVLARRERGRADPPARGAHRRRPQD